MCSLDHIFRILQKFLFGILIPMWELARTDSFDRDYKRYSKKREAELAAVLRNLDRFLEMLNHSKNRLCVQAGFLHNEPAGIVAIDQKGGGKGLQETRLYTYPDEESKNLYLILIGNKNSQSSDIKNAKAFVESNFS